MNIRLFSFNDTIYCLVFYFINVFHFIFKSFTLQLNVLIYNPTCDYFPVKIHRNKIMVQKKYTF